MGTVEYTQSRTRSGQRARLAWASRLGVAALLVSLAAGMTACVQFPTESQGVVDQRPQISFRSASGAWPADARVWIDGLDAGRLADFMQGSGALRVLSGEHLVQVFSGPAKLFEEKAYLGDGVSRAFLIR